MSDNGQRSLPPWRVMKPPQGARPMSSRNVPQPPYASRSYARPPSGAPQGLAQQFSRPPTALRADGAGSRIANSPAATFSGFRDRGLSGVFAAAPTEYGRPRSNNAYSAMPSSAEYEDMAGGFQEDMSLSGFVTTKPTMERHYAVNPTRASRAPRSFADSLGPPPTRMRMYPNYGGSSAPPGSDLHANFRRVARALAESGIGFPSLVTGITVEHTIQACAHFYALFSLLPPDFPHLDFTCPGGLAPAQVRQGLTAVDGLLRDVSYEYRRQAVGAMANLSSNENRSHALTAIAFLMELAQTLQPFLPEREQDEVPPMNNSLQYALYVERMMFAASMSTSPEITVPEARAYVDMALSQFQKEKAEAGANRRREIDTIEQEQAELARKQTEYAECETRERELALVLDPIRSSSASVEADLNTKRTELQSARESFDAVKAKLKQSSIVSPQRALELASALEAQQNELEKLDSELQQVTAKLTSERQLPVSQQLDALSTIITAYNKEVPPELMVPGVPKSANDVIGMSASDFISGQKMLAMSEEWKRATKEVQSNVSHLEKTAKDIDAQIAELEKSVASEAEKAVLLRVALEQLSSDHAAAQRDAQQLEHQFRLRDDLVNRRRTQGGVTEKEELLRETREKIAAAEATNTALESEMRSCADRKREIRVLLETYKVAYARLIECIGERESVMRRQEATVLSLQQVLRDYVPPNARHNTS